MTLVRKVDGEWVAARGVLELDRLISTRTVIYADGRTEQEDCEPYPVPFTLDMAKVEQLAAEGAWDADALAAYGLALAVPFVAPEGTQTVGAASYFEADGVVSEVYDVEDIPPPPPPLTAAEKLAAAGLTVDELRALLAEAE